MAVVTGFGYISAALAVIQDVPSVISAPQPLLEIYHQATSNKASSICLMMFPLVSFVLCAIDDMATAARMAYALSRDGGMPFNLRFRRLSPNSGTPTVGLLWCFGWDIILGLVFLGSNNAFNAIISAAVVCFIVTYAIPPGINLLRRRRMLPAHRRFKLPTAIGYICNAAGVVWAILTTILFVWPISNPTNAVNMNYCIVAFGVILVIAGSNWIFSARKYYKPPDLKLVYSPHDVVLALDLESRDEDQKGGKQGKITNKSPN
ncbi:hypothetical protein Golomagni_07703 [Golovinomyces magnicellulatus]|nr:hypothetical protein Golomagni_07703 [Golovinomyces magnicellulatus]